MCVRYRHNRQVPGVLHKEGGTYEQMKDEIYFQLELSLEWEI